MPVVLGIDPFTHPDAQWRFRVMHNPEELERALDYPCEKWTVFLHPAQEQLVKTDFNGPARVGGSAGTGRPSFRRACKRVANQAEAPPRNVPEAFQDNCSMVLLLLTKASKLTEPLSAPVGTSES